MSDPLPTMPEKAASSIPPIDWVDDHLGKYIRARTLAEKIITKATNANIKKADGTSITIDDLEINVSLQHSWV